MQFLHDSRWQHIANLVNGHLHKTTGGNIGHYRDEEQIFITMQGRYLGEIVNGNRLLYNLHSLYRSINFGNYGNYGNVGNYGNPGNIGNAGMPAGYRDIDPDEL